MYGLTTAARLSGMMMDIDRLYGTAVDKDNKRENVVALITSQGPRQSANEHLVPEALFDDPNSTEKEAEAISAVKALQIATQQGQKIFTINQTNISTVLPQLSHKATVMQDVKDAMAAGKIVTISQRTVSYQGWTGTGYIVTDPNTGAGAYLIGSGADGGIFLGALLTVFGLYFVGTSFVLFGAILLSIGLHLMVFMLAELIANGELDPKNIFLGSAAALSLMRALGVFFAAIGVTFVVPGGLLMGLILIALSVIGFSKIGV